MYSPSNNRFSILLVEMYRVSDNSNNRDAVCYTVHVCMSVICYIYYYVCELELGFGLE